MSNSSGCCVFEAPILIRFLPPLLIMEFIFGLVGNILALGMFVFDVQNWKPNSIYLAHMAVADILMLFCMPFRAHYYIRRQDWIFGDAFCRIILFLIPANRGASIFFLTAVAVDRYLRIVHPLHRLNRVNLGYAMWVAIGLWATVFLLTAQVLGTPHFLTVSNRTQCESFSICLENNLTSTWNSVLYVLEFIIPGCIITFCTICITWQLKTKTMDTTGKVKRAVKFIYIVVLVFFLCFFPSTATRLAAWVLKIWYNECSHFSDVNVAFFFTVCFTYLNSVLNPLIYYFSSPTSSDSIQEMFRKLTGQKKEVVSKDKSVASVISD